jgi:hypothetical protein
VALHSAVLSSLRCPGSATPGANTMAMASLVTTVALLVL